MFVGAYTQITVNSGLLLKEIDNILDDIFVIDFMEGTCLRLIKNPIPPLRFLSAVE